MVSTPSIHIPLPEWQAFIVLICRIGGLVAAMPILSGRTVPVKVKLALVFVLGAALSPIVQLPVVPADPIVLSAGLMSELAIGLTIGLAVRLFFASLELAGELIGIQMGFGVVQLFDPATSLQTPMMAQCLSVLATLVFLSLNAHVLVVATIVSSYEAIPVFGATLPAGLGEEVLHLSRQMFTLGVKLAAPVLLTILLINILLAILGRAVRQINVFVLSFPITIAGGLLVLGLAMPFMVAFMAHDVERLQMTIDALMKVLGHG